MVIMPIDKSLVLRFLESDPPWWWGPVMGPLILAAICWWIGLLTVLTFIVQMALVVLFVCTPIYVFMRLVTGGR